MTNDMEAGLRDEEPRSSGSMNSQADPETKPDEIPDGGYGWVVSLLVFALKMYTSNNYRSLQQSFGTTPTPGAYRPYDPFLEALRKHQPTYLL